MKEGLAKAAGALPGYPCMFLVSERLRIRFPFLKRL